MTAPFCPFCKQYHDPDVPCNNPTEQIFHEAGIKRPRKKMSRRKLKQLSDQADIALKIYLLIFAAITALILILFFTFST
ncbi:MAG: hypothetical protein JXD22_06055 [Sedimentisphaerales bacterium]|nr:hypothetical protein [Sedimentisphaerales bacterium]